MKKITIIILMLCLTIPVFAQSRISSTWERSFYKENDINLYASIGYVYGICVNAHGEWIINEFAIPGCPLDFGVMLNVSYQPVFGEGETAHGLGIGPTFSVHLGLKSVPIEFFISIGLGGALGISSYGTTGSFIFINVDGFVWHFSENFGLFVDFSLMGTGVNWGIGIEVAF